MNKEEIISIVESMGFYLDYDQWDKDNKSWLRFKLRDDLDEKDLRLIWSKNENLEWNFRRAAQIIFIAGQKEKMQQLQRYTEL